MGWREETQSRQIVWRKVRSLYACAKLFFQDKDKPVFS